MSNTIKYIRGYLEDLEKEMVALQEKADENTGKIMPVKSLKGIVENVYHNPGDFAKSDFRRACKLAREKLEKNMAEVEALHTKNLQALENNKVVDKKIRTIMQNVGIDAQYTIYDYPSSRHRTKQVIPKTAGFVDDIRRCVITDDGYAASKRFYETYLERIQEYENRGIAKEKEDARLAALEESRKKSEHVRAALCIKYNLAYDSDMQTIEHHLRGRDKYLDLAAAMEANREDWSDGYYYVACALSRFQPVSDDDVRIHACLSEIVEDYDDVDGRIFRDCYWNYSKIYDMADPELLKDFRIVRESCV